MKIETLLALTDLEEDSLTGLRAAYALARRHGARLVVGHVLVPRTLDSSHVAEFLQRHGLDPSVATVEIEVDADVHSGIDLIVERAKPDLIVLSSQRKRGLWRLLWASVPVGLIGNVRAPVLALHTGKEQDRFSNALVCVDGTKRDRLLLRATCALLEEEAEILALMVVEDSPLVIAGVEVGRFDDEVLEQARAAADKYLRGLRLSRPELNLHTEVRVGDAVDEIACAARESGADLVAVGSGGIGGAARFFLGKVAEGVVRHADVATLVVPTEDEDA